MQTGIRAVIWRFRRGIYASQPALNILFTKRSDEPGHTKIMLKRITVTVLTAAALCAPGFASANPHSADRSHDRQASPYALPLAQGFTSARPVLIPMQIAAVSVSPSQAKSIALRANRGAEFLDIKLVGGKTYIVRLMKAGQRFDVRVDARSGQIVG